MSGHKNFKQLRDRVVADSDRRARVERISREYDAVLALADIRESLGFTQAELAELLEVSQPNVSKLEHKDDIYLSTLSSYIAALGGELELRAVFPNGSSFRLTLPKEVERQQKDALQQATEQLTNSARQSFQMLTNRPEALQKHDLEFTQNFFQNCIEQIQNQTEGTWKAMQGLQEQGQRLREVFETLSPEDANAYSELLNSVLKVYQETLRSARATKQFAQQTARSAQQEAGDQTPQETRRGSS